MLDLVISGSAIHFRKKRKSCNEKTLITVQKLAILLTTLYNFDKNGYREALVKLGTYAMNLLITIWDWNLVKHDKDRETKFSSAEISVKKFTSNFSKGILLGESLNVPNDQLGTGNS
jgi:hypothetical protein